MAKRMINWKSNGNGKTGFINTGFVTPYELEQAAEELKNLATTARAQQKFVRIWCDRGAENKKPYTQLYIDKMPRAERQAWFKERVNRSS